MEEWKEIKESTSYGNTGEDYRYEEYAPGPNGYCQVRASFSHPDAGF